MNPLSGFQSIRCFVFDVDGVMTDGSLFVLENGEQLRTMSIRDGYALQRAVKKGYRIAIISGAEQAGVVQRLQRLGIRDIYSGVENKKERFDQYLMQNELPREAVLYMGDDLPDLEAMQAAGLPVCPADAAPEIKAVSRYISPFGGGKGCVRDVIEKVLKLNGDWHAAQSI